MSIKEEQQLTLVASSLKDVDGGLIDSDAAPLGKVLPAAVIYGANASGKSNLVSALRFMRTAILSSHRHGDPEGGVPRQPFMLDSNCAEKASLFDIDFTVDELRYNYGFEASDEAFVSEWLFSYPRGRRQMLFERKGSEFNFGRALRGRNRVISELTRSNSLFLSAAVQNDHEQLKGVSRFFGSITIYDSLSLLAREHALSDDDLEVDPRVVKFLEAMGTGIVDLRKTEEERPEKSADFMHELSAVFHKVYGEKVDFSELLSRKNVKIELGHRGSEGKVVFLGIENESAGTRALLQLLDPLLRALDKGTLIVVDELDASLHTLACAAIIDMFSSHQLNRGGAQLIATTHDTNLLNVRSLRRDQVWFTEKNSEGETCLFPLSDIRTRKGDNIEKGYLQGRFGAIPFSGSLEDLFAET